MTKLFDPALPPIWYFVFWIALMVGARLWIVNPLITALERATTAIITAQGKG